VRLQYHAKKPFGGRLVQNVCPEYNLKLHDRLHTGGSLLKLADYDTLDSFPAKLFFYRSMGSHLNGVCPLTHYAGLETGIFGLTLESIEFDVLHTIDMGVTQKLVGFILMLILDSDVFRTGFHM
jgi:hypothetical protein